MASVREVVRTIIDEVRRGKGQEQRVFLDKTIDYSEFDVDDPNLPKINTTITIDKKEKVTVKRAKNKRALLA